MAYEWEHVEAIRAAQSSARERFNQDVVAGGEMATNIIHSPGGKETDVRNLDSWDAKLFKLRTQLIDYIIEHGLVQGFNWDGNDYPIQNGKIVVTPEMVKMVTDRFGYFTEKETLEFVEKYLPEHDYVSDAEYVHTDNNYTDGEKEKLATIEEGAEVNAILNIIFNGNTVLDPETKVATITVTPEMVKEWYESNTDTNAFTDAEKEKLVTVKTNAEPNKVNDVTLDGETIVKDKVAALTAQKIKNAYESNPDTNAYTDAAKTIVETIIPGMQTNIADHEKRIDALEVGQSDVDTEIAKLQKKDLEHDNSIAEINAKDTEQDGKISALETDVSGIKSKDSEQDNEIQQLKTDIARAGKVDDVQVNGVSVVTDKIAKIPEIPDVTKLVPYTGATDTVNLNGQAVTTESTVDSISYRITLTPDKLGAEAESDSGEQLTTYMNPQAVSFSHSKDGNLSIVSIDQANDNELTVSYRLSDSQWFTAPVNVASPTKSSHAVNLGFLNEKLPTIKRIEVGAALDAITSETDYSMTFHQLKSNVATALGKPPSGKTWKLLSAFPIINDSELGFCSISVFGHEQTDYSAFDQYVSGFVHNFLNTDTTAKTLPIISYYIAE